MDGAPKKGASHGWWAVERSRSPWAEIDIHRGLGYPWLEMTKAALDFQMKVTEPVLLALLSTNEGHG